MFPLPIINSVIPHLLYVILVVWHNFKRLSLSATCYLASCRFAKQKYVVLVPTAQYVVIRSCAKRYPRPRRKVSFVSPKYWAIKLPLFVYSIPCPGAHDLPCPIPGSYSTPLVCYFPKIAKCFEIIKLNNSFSRNKGKERKILYIVR